MMDIKTLDLNLLTALDALLTELSVTKAAKRLRISQPALSARLRRLRVLFDDPLLTRSQRGMVPTHRALELQEPLRLALEQLQGVAAAHARFDAKTARLTVSIAASDYVYYTFLMPLILSLRKAAPFVRVALCAMDGSRLGDQMERGEIDIGLLTPSTAPQHLRSRALFDERYLCIARRDHPVVRGKIDLETFCSLEHVVVSPRGSGFVGPTDAALKARGLARKVVVSVTSFLVVPELVARSDMLALVPERLVRKRSKALQVMPPPIPVDGFSIAMVWHDRTTLAPGLRWMREAIAGL